MIEENEYIRLKEDYNRLKTAVNELAIPSENAIIINSTVEFNNIVTIVLNKNFSLLRAKKVKSYRVIRS